jgi:hypothetical protein
MEVIMKILNKIKCFFGFHKWINIDDNDYSSDKPVLVSSLHRCERCKKEEYKGMGIQL